MFLCPERAILARFAGRARGFVARFFETWTKDRVFILSTPRNGAVEISATEYASETPKAASDTRRRRVHDALQHFRRPYLTFAIAYFLPGASPGTAVWYRQNRCLVGCMRRGRDTQPARRSVPPCHPFHRALPLPAKNTPAEAGFRQQHGYQPSAPSSKSREVYYCVEQTGVIETGQEKRGLSHGKFGRAATQRVTAWPKVLVLQPSCR
jgi:hypothetical protein